MWFVIGYGIVTLACARFIYAYMCRDKYMKPEDGVDIAMTGFMSLLTALFWPLVLPIGLIIWRPRKSPEQILAERDAKIAEQAAYIRKLEIENGIGQYGR